MKIDRTHYWAKTGLLLLAAAALISVSRSNQGKDDGKTQGPDVRVVNTKAEPVPVTLQGSAQALPVALQGSVQLDTSTPLPVKNVNSQAHEAAQFTLFVPPNGPNYTVPAGKQLVIEFVSGSFATKSSETTSIGEALLEVSGASGITHVFPGTVTAYEAGVPFPYRFAFSQACRIYASAGAQVSLRGGFALGSISVSGHLVDLP